MVAGGLPEPRADHLQAVARTALAMRDEIAAIAERPGHGWLAVRIGIDGGPGGGGRHRPAQVHLRPVGRHRQHREPDGVPRAVRGRSRSPSASRPRSARRSRFARAERSTSRARDPWRRTCSTAPSQAPSHHRRRLRRRRGRSSRPTRDGDRSWAKRSPKSEAESPVRSDDGVGRYSASSAATAKESSRATPNATRSTTPGCAPVHGSPGDQCEQGQDGGKDAEPDDVVGVHVPPPRWRTGPSFHAGRRHVHASLVLAFTGAGTGR